ncbi:DUF7266 family protein [Saliphagus infecundisoli]|uniref:Uncharacterized protein n=1 Tax=Saliphagus infecundisoli TaxID=1849069 RepID=A0ABD5QA37_9EURY|nr:hypothetical protein [Saliphagus infecundisoli]
MTGPRGLRGDDRGVSVALSHVLTMGITAVLIAGLLMGASAMLDGQSERGADRSLETIGERVASEVASVDRLAREDPRPGTVELRVDHPDEVSGRTYSVGLSESDCGTLIQSACVVLSAPGARTTVQVPLAIDTSIASESAQGGEMRIIYDGDEIRLESGYG